MRADDQVRARFRKLDCLFILPVIRLHCVFRAPVYENDHAVTVFLCLPDLRDQPFRIHTAENSRRTVCCAHRIRIAHAFDLGRAYDPDLGLTIGIVPDPRCFIQIMSGADIRHPDPFKRIKGVKHRLLSVVIDMIVGKPHDVHSHIFQQRGVFRPRTESELLLFERRAAC